MCHIGQNKGYPREKTLHAKRLQKNPTNRICFDVSIHMQMLRIYVTRNIKACAVYILLLVDV